eukprot:115793-Prorocentrum_minimum.AAC.3
MGSNGGCCSIRVGLFNRFGVTCHRQGFSRLGRDPTGETHFHGPRTACPAIQDDTYDRAPAPQEALFP